MINPLMTRDRSASWPGWGVLRGVQTYKRGEGVGQGGRGLGSETRINH